MRKLLCGVACAALLISASQVSAQAPAPSGSSRSQEQGGASGTTGQGGMQRQSPARNDDKGGATEEKSAPRATQGQRDGGAVRGNQEQRKDNDGGRNVQTDERPRNGAPAGRESEGGRTSGQGAAASHGKAAVNLNASQKTRVHQIAIKENVKKVSKVSFNLAVGTRVPRTEVELRPVSREIVEIVPDYRGYLFFVYNDDVVIVDPDTLEIVAVIQA